MEIHLNMTFPRLPCELLTLDVMDVSGEQQVGVAHGVNKVRLSPAAEGGRALDVQALDLYVPSSQLPVASTNCSLATPAMTPNTSTLRTAVNAAAPHPHRTPSERAVVTLARRFAKHTR